MPLDRPDRPVDVGHGLVLGRLADQHLAVPGERDDGRGGAGALGVRDDRRLATLQDGDDGVGGPEVDADRTSHGVLPPAWLSCLDSSLSAAGAGRQTVLESDALNLCLTLPTPGGAELFRSRAPAPDPRLPSERLGTPGWARPELDAAVASVGMQVNRDNVLRARGILLAEADRLDAEMV